MFPIPPTIAEKGETTNKYQNLSVEKLVSNAEILIIGGSETTASLLSGVTYLLLQNEKAYETLRDEVRSTFQSEDEIDLVSVNKLSYMLACLDEGLRMYPPIANGLPRVCPKGGSRVLGEYIPEFVRSYPSDFNAQIYAYSMSYRQIALCINGRSTAARSISKTLILSIRNAFLDHPSSRMIEETFSNHSILAQETAWGESKCFCTQSIVLWSMLTSRKSCIQ